MGWGKRVLGHSSAGHQLGAPDPYLARSQARTYHQMWGQSDREGPTDPQRHTTPRESCISTLLPQTPCPQHLQFREMSSGPLSPEGYKPDGWSAPQFPAVLGVTGHLKQKISHRAWGSPNPVLPWTLPTRWAMFTSCRRGTHGCKKRLSPTGLTTSSSTAG